jgi:hypothetical protein
MRKVSPEIARCVLFGAIAFILGACIKPVGVSTFLKDDRVQGIINGNSGVIVNPGYENPEDIPPELKAGTRLLIEGDTVTVSMGNRVTITVTNAAKYDGGIEWFCGDGYLSSGNTYTVNTASPPFNEEGTYQLAVVGTRDNVPYSIEIFVVVED